MNVHEALELVNKGRLSLDELAELESTDGQLAAETEEALEREKIVWTNVPGAGEVQANLADDRGTEAFLVSQGGERLITGHDNELHSIQPGYARAFGLKAIGQIRAAESRLRTEE